LDVSGMVQAKTLRVGCGAQGWRGLWVERGAWRAICLKDVSVLETQYSSQATSYYSERLGGLVGGGKSACW
jgi:hypothetical protein